MYENLELNEELCEFVGAFIGDGCIVQYNKSYQLQFTGDADLDLQYYNNIIKSYGYNLFNKEPIIKKAFRGNAIRVNYNSKDIVQFLNKRFNFNLGKKTLTVKIPDEIIKNKDIKLIFSTIRGIFDTDGCIFFDTRENYKKPYPRITLQISSKNLYIQLKSILSKYFNLYTRENIIRKTNYNISKVFYIEIYGHNQLEKWLNLIGFSNPRHLNKIKAPVA